MLPLLRKRLAHGALTGLVALGWFHVASAQSAFIAVSTIKPAATQGGFGVLQVDNSDRINGHAMYPGPITWGFPFFTPLPNTSRTWVPYPSRWAASTATSVSPTKTGKANELVRGVSPSGNKLAILGPQAILLDVPSGQRTVIQGEAGEYVSVEAVNDQGWLAGYVNQPRASEQASPYAVYRAAVWRPGQARELLPNPDGFVGARAIKINARGDVLGVAYEPAHGAEYAVVWVNAVPRVLDTRAQRHGRAVAINDAGQVLHCSGTLRLVDGHDPALAPTPVADEETCWLTTERTTTEIKGPAGRTGYVTALANSGTVLGYEADGALNSRAFIWMNGSSLDFTTFAKGKGAKLPAGAVLTYPESINSKGTVLTMLRASSGAFSSVRLQAKP